MVIRATDPLFPRIPRQMRSPTQRIETWQTSLREWAYAAAYQHSRQRRDQLANWLLRYNWHRPHAGIAAKTPISRLGLTEDNLLRLHI